MLYKNLKHKKRIFLTCLVDSIKKVLFFDSFASAAAAYSLRRLSSTYLGNAIRVRRSTDNAELDIGFASDGLNTSAMLNHCVPTDIQALYGNRMAFDGVDDYISIADDDDFSFGDGATDSPFSVSATFSVPAAVASNPLMSKAADTSPGNPEWLFNTDSLFKFILYDTDNSSANSIRQTSTMSVEPGVIYNFTATYDGSGTAAGIKLYIDGVLITSTPTVNGTYVSMNNSASPLEIGAALRASAFDSYLTGTIYDTYIFDEELSASDVLALYNGDTSGLSVIGNWEGTSNLDSGWEDQTVNGRDGTVADSPELFSGQGYDGFVSTWYDQSGNSRNATQATAANQPRVFENGSTFTTNNKPSLDFYSGSLLEGTAFDSGTSESIFHVVNNQAADTTRKLFYKHSTFPDSGVLFNYRGDVLAGDYDGVNYNGIQNNITYNDTTSPSQFISTLISLSTGHEVFKDGTTQGSNAVARVNASDILSIGSTSLGNGFDSQELIIYGSDETASRVGIESNINNYWKVF